jgi:hypothetical protein
VGADPKPFNFVLAPDGESTVAVADSDGPEFAHFFEMQRRMGRIAKPEFEVFPGQPLKFRRKTLELRKLFVIEEVIKRNIGLPMVLRFQPLISVTELAALGIVFDLAIPFAVPLSVKPLLQFNKFPLGKTCDGSFDLDDRTHGC